MNRVGLGLAVGAGYVLGRTKKMKMAFAVGTLVAGKRMQLSPRALMNLANQQLQNNPQFKEIGDQLREDLRGVGQAASGALVERQVEALADRLHGRTEQVRGQLAGVAPDLPGLRDDEEPENEREERDEYEDEESEEPDEAAEAEAEGEPEDEAEGRDESEESEEPQKGAAKKTAKKAAKKAPSKRSASKGLTKKAAAKKTAGKKTAATSAKKAPAKKTAARGRSAEGRRGR